MQLPDADLLAILASSPDAIVVVDEAGAVVTANPAADALFGRPPGGLVGCAAIDLLPRQAMRTVAEPSWRGGFDVVRPDGTCVPVEVYPVALRHRDPEWSAVFVRDATARARASADLAEADARYRAVVEAQAELICRFRLDSTLTFVNDAYCRFFGRRREDLVGTRFLALLPEAARPAVHDRLARQAAAPHRETYEHDVLLPDGMLGRQEWTDIPVCDAAGRLLELQGVGRDVSARYRAEEALRASEARFRSLVANAADFITVLDANGAIRYESPSLRRALGYAPEALVGIDAFSLVHPDDHEPTKAAFAALVADPSRQAFVEFRFRHADGSWRWLEATGSNLLADRAVAGVVVNSRDVTERKEGEARLREAEARYRELVEMIPAVVTVNAADETNALLYASPRVAELFGEDPAELVADPGLWTARVHPDDRGRLRAEVERTARTGEPFRLEYRRFARDGREVWVRDEGVLVRDADGSPLRWQSVIIDVTERRRTVERLRASEARYRRLVEQIPAVVVAWASADPARLTYASPRLRTVLGYDPAEALAEPDFLTNRTHPDDVERVRAAEVRAVAEGAPVREEYRLRAADGRWVWVRDEAVPVGDGRAAVWQAVITDVSKQKAAEAVLRAAKEAAEQADRLKSAFLSTMTHELRTPLTSVVGYADLLRSVLEGRGMADEAEDAATILRAGAHLLALINDVLDLSRIQAGGVELDRDRVDCAAAVAEVVVDLAPLAAAKGISLSADVPDGLTVTADPLRLRQILLNLVGNAVKFTEAGSVSVTARRVSGGVTLTVIDTGIGIAPEALPRIFDEFRQADERTTRRYGGTGLGLAICKRLAELHGGSIEVESEPGVGSTFAVWLPDPPTVDVEHQRSSLGRGV